MTKHAIITGASRGIGSAISEHLAEKNYALHLISKNKNNLQKAFDKITKTSKETVETHSLDLNNPNKVTLFCRETLPSIPVPDVFVANAGILHAGTLNTTTEDLQASYQVNVLSTITLCNAVCERMKTKGGGHIFILGSNAACIHRESVGIYSSTKAAIGHYAQTLFNTMILQAPLRFSAKKKMLKHRISADI